MRSMTEISSSHDILCLLSNTDRGADTTPELKIKIDSWINTTVYESRQLRPDGVLNDLRLYGNYDVSYVGTGKSQRGNPAGGRYRGTVGRFLFQNEALFQNIIEGENTTIVINIVRGKIFSFLPFRVILYGLATVLNTTERSRLTQKYGTILSPGTVRAEFQPPLLCVGGALNSLRSTLRIGPPSSVVLDTPYVDENVRLGVGSRGSTFIFKRTSDPTANEWREWMAVKPLRAKQFGVQLCALGLVLSLGVSSFIQTFVKLPILGNVFKFIGATVGAVGVFLFMSKGGIIED